ncbi:hypothetical protein GLP30_17230 [Photobacterium phosphoreum]|uniref:Uncharacterized protein n=1 Tax=Photobacterium phosphoreum TaxID=659 RepID=A0AAW4ZSR6_PHOPO|nr:hypothetical protein [Photobacterium phosphoreum]MCD9492603.1 hypothetical protein [Photobacterium phosphoreum]MCF2191832.1 hypothetical protein [Photobacterium phosphoreum]MCF2303435.1 hypothetical protein [Photobacterium phosphoreum]
MTNSTANHSTITNQLKATKVSPLESKDSNKNEILTFTVVKGSDVSPAELQRAGVKMNDFKYSISTDNFKKILHSFHIINHSDNPTEAKLEFIRIW